MDDLSKNFKTKLILAVVLTFVVMTAIFLSLENISKTRREAVSVITDAHNRIEKRQKDMDAKLDMLIEQSKK